MMDKGLFDELKQALENAEKLAEGDSNDAEIEAWQDLGEIVSRIIFVEEVNNNW